MADATKFAVRQKGEPVRVKRFHLTEECPRIRDTPDNEILGVDDALIDLLGLKLCTTCEQRANGGPAVSALEGFFGEDWPGEGGLNPEELAWKLHDYLRDNGFYISQRKRKEQEPAQ